MTTIPPDEAATQPEPVPTATETIVVAAPPAVPRAERLAALATHTVSLLAALLACGALLLAFTFATVHRRPTEELIAHWQSARAQYEITHWMEHGYFDSAGLLVRKSGKTGLPEFYRSATGGVLLTGFLVEKIYASVTGAPNWQLLALHNQAFSLLTSAVLALLAFRLARRIGAAPLHAFAMALAVEAVHFTFPDNLMVFWEMSGRVPFLLAAGVFLLLEEASLDAPSRLRSIAQGVAAFFVMYAEFVAGTAFLVSYVVVALLLGGLRPSVKRLALVAVLPMLLALGVYRVQLRYAASHHPEMGMTGSDFGFRTGLDGSAQYYIDHLAIAYGRHLARANFSTPEVRDNLFRWTWLFYAGTLAVLAMAVASMRGRVPRVAMLALLSLLGTYLLYAAVFSQAVMIHPYYFDVLLFTPLILALFALAPALLQSWSRDGSVAVIAIVFLAVWVSMVQLRKYALTFPPPKPPAAKT